MPNCPADVSVGAPNLDMYTDNGDGTITDRVTSLMWQQVAPTATYTLADAVAYCPALRLAGHNDWRVPSIIELVSIVDYGRHNPSIDNVFLGTQANWFWASIPGAGSPTWAVDFSLGYTGYHAVAETLNVRCVR